MLFIEVKSEQIYQILALFTSICIINMARMHMGIFQIMFFVLLLG